MATERAFAVNSDTDIVRVRQECRELAAGLGFNSTDLTLITTAISELARNILFYAGHGEIIVASLNHGERIGLMVTARDHGPGIPDVELAMQAGYSTSGNLGLGLPGVRRIMDEFNIASTLGEGTTVTARKWRA